MLYSLGVSPHTLYFLKFEWIQDNRELELIDTKIYEIKTIILSNELYNDLRFLNPYKN